MNWVFWILWLSVTGFAFVDCLRQPTDAFPAIRRQNKVLWCVLTGAAAVSAITIPWDQLPLLPFLGLVAALIYLINIRPKINRIMG